MGERLRSVVRIDTDPRVEEYFNVEYAQEGIAGVDICIQRRHAIYKSPEEALKFIQDSKRISRQGFDFDAFINGAALGIGISLICSNFDNPDAIFASVGGAALTASAVTNIARNLTKDYFSMDRENMARRSLEKEAVLAFFKQQEEEGQKASE